MSPAPDTSLDEARSLLDAHLGRSVGALELVGEGTWSRCFGFELDGRELVVRVGEQLDDFEKDRRAAAFARPGLPVPAVLSVAAVGGGRYLAVSERGRGVALESLDRSAWRTTLPSLLAALDALRSVDPAPSVTGAGLWDGRGVGSQGSWRSYLIAVADDPPSSRIHGWRAALAGSVVGDATFAAGLARLTELAEAAPDHGHVVHGDLLNRNVLVRPDGAIDTVFDWGCSLVGDHLYDLATLVFWSAWYPELTAVDVRAAAVAHLDRVGAEVGDFDARLLACQLHHGLQALGSSAWLGLDDALRWTDAHVAALL